MNDISVGFYPYIYLLVTLAMFSCYLFKMPRSCPLFNAKSYNHLGRPWMAVVEALDENNSSLSWLVGGQSIGVMLISPAYSQSSLPGHSPSTAASSLRRGSDPTTPRGSQGKTFT